MKAIIEEKVIEMSKSEAARAGIYNSEEFRALKELREQFSDYRINVRKTKSRDCMKGLTVAYMKKYILVHELNQKQNLEQFYLLRGRNEKGEREITLPIRSYGELKMWFLATYPEVEKNQEKVDQIMDEVRAARADKKIA